MTQSPRSRRHPIHASQQHTCEVIRERLQPVPVRPPSSTRRPKVLGKPQRRELTAHQPNTHMTTARRPTLRLARLHLGRERADPPLPPQRRVVHAHPVAPPPLDDHTSLLSSSHSLHSVALNFRMPADHLRRHPVPHPQLHPTRREPEVRGDLAFRQPRLRPRPKRHPDQPAHSATTESSCASSPRPSCSADAAPPDAPTRPECRTPATGHGNRSACSRSA